ncbi:hypothetical protein QMY54_05042 [Pseudomonas rhodesiae]|nr:hypothetical protein QMY54_05042 [Pseudomonas rhodesiae]
MDKNLITLNKSDVRFFKRIGSAEINREIHVMNMIFQIVQDKGDIGKGKLRIRISFKDPF